jgi:hypothetical protein
VLTVTAVAGWRYWTQRRRLWRRRRRRRRGSRRCLRRSSTQTTSRPRPMSTSTPRSSESTQRPSHSLCGSPSRCVQAVCRAERRGLLLQLFQRRVRVGPPRRRVLPRESGRGARQAGQLISATVMALYYNILLGARRCEPSFKHLSKQFSVS